MMLYMKEKRMMHFFLTVIVFSHLYIDYYTAVSDNGFKIMSLLYLTPVIPLGPLSYVMGTTSMPLISFAKAKIAALPLTVLYVYLGAATGTLVASSEEVEDNLLDPSGGSSSGKGSVPNAKKGMSELKVDPKLIVFGILFSIVSIAVISIKMKQELQKVSKAICLHYVVQQNKAQTYFNN